MEELMLLNCSFGEDSWESLGLQGQTVNPKGNQSWIFIGRTDAEAEAPVLWPPDEKSWLIGKNSDAGKDWRQEEKGMGEDEMVGWHHQLNGHEFEQAPGDGEGPGGLACCTPWGHKESDMTEWLMTMTMTKTMTRCHFNLIFFCCCFKLYTEENQPTYWSTKPLTE